MFNTLLFVGLFLTAVNAINFDWQAALKKHFEAGNATSIQNALPVTASPDSASKPPGVIIRSFATRPPDVTVPSTAPPSPGKFSFDLKVPVFHQAPLVRPPAQPLYYYLYDPSARAATWRPTDGRRSWTDRAFHRPPVYPEDGRRIFASPGQYPTDTLGRNARFDNPYGAPLYTRSDAGLGSNIVQQPQRGNIDLSFSSGSNSAPSMDKAALAKASLNGLFTSIFDGVAGIVKATGKKRSDDDLEKLLKSIS